MTAARRLIRINAANLKNNHLYVTGLRDLFPPEAIGGPRRKGGNGHGFELILDGLNKTVVTDIGSDARTGKPRGFLRCRSEIGHFYRHHAIKPGGYVELQRLAERKFRLSVPRRRAAEFFAASAWCASPWKRKGGRWSSPTTSIRTKRRCTGTTGRKIVTLFWATFTISTPARYRTASFSRRLSRATTCPSPGGGKG